MEGSIDRRLEAKLGFDRVRQTVADRCGTEYAARRTEEELFCTDAREIERRLQLTNEMKMILMFEDRFPVDGYIDCVDFLKILDNPGSNIDIMSLGKLRTMCDTLRKVSAFFSSIKDGVYPMVGRMVAKVSLFPEVSRRIDLILDKYGNVKDTASPRLSEIRKSLKDKENAISRKANAILRQAQQDGFADADATVSMRDGRMLVPIGSANKRRVSGVVYDQSASGKTTFIVPTEVVEMENEISELRFEENREISVILSEFSDFLRPYVPELICGAECLGELDFLLAKARTALDYIAGMPIISDNGEMHLRKARHPLLEKALGKEGRQIVPLTATLTPQKHILLISGPNAGGKSVCLKTVGLIQYMFQWGMLIPTSEASEMVVLDRIMVSIGDDQSIDNDLSTYSAFLADMKRMLSRADGKTMVLIDEFGSGTEPAAGGAIAEAILSELDRRGVYGVITTHYTNLKLYAASRECGVTNGAMQFDGQKIEPLFKLEMGLPGNSFAFELARKCGLPEAIVKDAEGRAGDEFVGMERNLRRIARNRRAIDERLQRIKKTDANLETITDKYQKELSDIQKMRREILDNAKAEAERIVSEANKKVENTIRTIRETQAERDKTREARQELQKFMEGLGREKERQEQNRQDYLDKKLEQLDKRQAKDAARKESRMTPEERMAAQSKRAEQERMEKFRAAVPKVGEKVRVKSNGMVGEVMKVSSHSVTLSIGNVTSTMSHDKVERITLNEYRNALKDMPKPPKPTYRQDASIAERKLSFRPELDVRGERLADAMDIVMRYVDDAIMLGMPSVRIIHGKGTGVLREEIQKLVRTMPGVSSVADEQVQFGGSGVSIVKFD